MDAKGFTMRVHLESAAARGVKSAIQLLDSPERPEALEYLYGWSLELAGARTMGMHGPNGFTYEMIAAWARLMDRSPSPLEVRALFAIDIAMRFPDAGRQEED